MHNSRVPPPPAAAEQPARTVLCSGCSHHRYRMSRVCNARRRPTFRPLCRPLRCRCSRCRRCSWCRGCCFPGCAGRGPGCCCFLSRAAAALLPPSGGRRLFVLLLQLARPPPQRLLIVAHVLRGLGCTCTLIRQLVWLSCPTQVANTHTVCQHGWPMYCIPQPASGCANPAPPTAARSHSASTTLPLYCPPLRKTRQPWVPSQHSPA